MLMVNIGSLSTGGRVIAVKADLAKIGLTTPGKMIITTFILVSFIVLGTRLPLQS